MIDAALNPYVGLRPFDHADSLYFFGRRPQITELLQQLHDTRFLGVVGSSGCGKSSLIRAGLIPALLGGFLVQDRDRWLIAKMKPGGGPLHNLAGALCALDGHEPSVAEIRKLAAALHEDAMDAALDYLKPRLGGDANLLLLLDQFEEIFAFRGRDEDVPTDRAERKERLRCQREAEDFIDLVLSLSRQTSTPVYVVLTMRSDFLGDCDQFYGLPEAMNLSRYLVPRLSRSQLSEAIEGPPMLVGQSLAPRLVDALLNELGERSDQLPILQHALMRSWDFWRRGGGTGPIDLEHYQEAGTLSEALPRHASEALRETDTPVVARIFKCLTDTDANHRRVRRSASLSELMAVSVASREQVEGILERFNEDRRNFLLISRGSDADTTRVEISHESLIRQWEQLARWVDEERESRDQFHELVDRGRRGRALLQDPDLQIALNWCEAAQPTAAWAQRYSQDSTDLDVALDYLERSRHAKAVALSQRRRNRNLAISAAVLAMGVLSALSLWALGNAARAREHASRAQDLAYVALAGDWLEADPTRAALLLLEVAHPSRANSSAARMRGLLGQRVASHVLRGHEAPLTQLTFSPEGARIATSSRDGTARVWIANGAGPTLVLRGHDDLVSDVAFSPDGERVATASHDGTARVWPLAGGGEAVVLRGHEAPLETVEWSPDGSLLVTSSKDDTARVWRADGSGEPLVLRGHEDGVRAAVFSPDGSRIATASEDGTARVWRSDGSAEPIVLRGHQGSLTTISFSSDGSRILTGAAGGTIRIWDPGIPDESLLLGKENWLSIVNAASFSPDGSQVLSTMNNESIARLWETDGSGEYRAIGDPDADSLGILGIEAAVFSPDGEWIATNAPRAVQASSVEQGAITLWPTDDSGEPLVLRGHEEYVGVLEFSPDGTQLATGSEDGTGRVWQLGPPSEPVVLAPDSWIVFGAWSPDGSRVATADEDGGVLLWNADDAGEPVVLEGHEGSVVTLAFSPNGSRIASGAEDETARVWATEGRGEPVVLTGHDGTVTAVAFDPEGARIVTGSDDETARVWNADGSGEAVVLEGHEGSVDALAFSPDGKRVATGSDDGTARVWNADGSGSPVVLRGHERGVESVAFSPDGSRIVTASSDATARVWNADGSGEPVILAGHGTWISTAAWSPDGKQIVTASDDTTARIWNSDDSGQSLILRGHEGQVATAAFDGDGSHVVTASADGTARVWRADGSGAPLVLAGHEERLLQASFSPDGTRILTTSADGTARIWSYAADRLQRVIASMTKACLDPSFRENSLEESPSQARQAYERCESSHGRAP